MNENDNNAHDGWGGACGHDFGGGNACEHDASRSGRYCKTVGYPKGCVARPAGAVAARPAGAVVARPAGPVVYCTRVGYPKGCVVR